MILNISYPIHLFLLRYFESREVRTILLVSFRLAYLSLDIETVAWAMSGPSFKGHDDPPPKIIQPSPFALESGECQESVEF